MQPFQAPVPLGMRGDLRKAVRKDTQPLECRRQFGHLPHGPISALLSRHRGHLRRSEAVFAQPGSAPVRRFQVPVAAYLPADAYDVGLGKAEGAQIVIKLDQLFHVPASVQVRGHTFDAVRGKALPQQRDRGFGNHLLQVPVSTKTRGHVRDLAVAESQLPKPAGQPEHRLQVPDPFEFSRDIGDVLHPMTEPGQLPDVPVHHRQGGVAIRPYGDTGDMVHTELRRKQDRAQRHRSVQIPDSAGADMNDIDVGKSEFVQRPALPTRHLRGKQVVREGDILEG